MSGVTAKTRLYVRLDEDLKEWVQDYAMRNNTTASDLVRAHFIALKREEDIARNADCAEQI